MTSRSHLTDAAVSRRRVLIGLGAAMAAPAALMLPRPAAAEAAPGRESATRAESAPAQEPECLSGLLQEGRMTYGDLMAR